MTRKSKYKKLVGRPVVVDANVLFDLMELNSLYLLNDVFGQVLIPQATIAIELDNETRECLNNIEHVAEVITSAKGYEVYALCHKRKVLSHCDKMAIAIAAENSFILCTNEGPARRQGAVLKLEITGTLGILAAAYESGIIDQIKVIQLYKYLDQEGSCYISQDLLYEVLSDLGISIEEFQE